MKRNRKINEFDIRYNVLVRYHPQDGKTDVVIPNGVTGIGASSFEGCSALTSITIPESVKIINENAFSGCSALTSITIPESVNSIYYNAFGGCDNLVSVTVLVNLDVKLFYSRLFGSEKLKEIYIKPDCISKINNKKNVLIAYNTMLNNLDNYLGYPRATLVAALKKRKKELSEWLVSNDSENISIILSLFKYSIDDLDKLLALATVKNAIQCKAYLLEYKNNNYSKDSIEQERTRKTNVALGISEPTINDIRELWKLKRSEKYPNKYEIYDYNGTDEVVVVPSSISGVEVAVVGRFNNYKVRKVIIPNGVQCIKSYTFWYHEYLEEIVIPDSVSEIGEGAFDFSQWYAKQPEGVVYAGKIAYKCKGIVPQTVTLKKGIVKISSDAFGDCCGLKSIFIPEGVTVIGDRAFRDCRELTSIFLPNSVTEIGKGAFCGCSSLTSISIPESVANIGENTFENCSALTSATIPEGVTEIGKYAFSGCSKLNSIIIPDSVASIGENAFENCSALTSITIPKSVTEIGKHAFSGCSSLTSITISGSLNSINERVLYGCSSLASIIIPNSVTSIGNEAFSGCSSLASITIPDRVISIGGNAFSDTLWYANQPDGVVYFGKVAYKYKGEETQTVVIKEGVVSIASDAFSNCKRLLSITLPDGVTFIGNYAFSGCSCLTSITLPHGVTCIGIGAFYDCISLTHVTTPKSFTSNAKYSYYNGGILTRNTIPKGFISNAKYSFYNCGSLSSINLPDSVTGIGDYAFCGCCAIISITIPASVTSIGDYTFNHCCGLTQINCIATAKPDKWNDEWQGDCKAKVVWGYKEQ